MTGSAPQAMDVVYEVASRREDSREGVQGEGRARCRPLAGGWRITGSDRDFSLELDVGYRSDSVSPKGLYDGREFILDQGRGPGRGEGGRGRSRIFP